MLALGLNVSGYITSAALVRDGEILAGVCEERLSRVKRDRAFPIRAARSCLEIAGAAPGDVDSVVVAWNPAHHMGRNLRMLHEANRSRARYLTYVPNELAALFGTDPGDRSTQELLGTRVTFLDHHLAHAASAAFTSPWSQGAVVTIDAFGEQDTMTIGRFAGNDIEIFERIRFPHSVGAFYSYVTEFLGFRADADEYKVMALGAFADEAQGEALRQRMSLLYTAEERDGRFHFELDLGRFDHYLFDRPHDFGPFASVVGMPPRAAGEPLTEEHYALAWALGRTFETIVERALAHARRRTGEPVAALAGGCFMNSVANGKLLGMEGAFDDVFIPPYPDDSGTAIGAALLATLEGTTLEHREYRHGFFGPSVSTTRAEEKLRYRKVGWEPVDAVGEEVAAAVARGELVGFAVGAMEFGQRALGHRSILADPRDPDVRAILNERVKNREFFRPYGVSILATHAEEVFDTGPAFRADFMERVRFVRPEWRDRIRGVVHADGSVRLHLVEHDSNPELFAVLEAFHRRTGVPLLVNTSFNVSGMPIVASEEHAIDCFFACGLDTLFVDRVCVRKGWREGTPSA